MHCRYGFVATNLMPTEHYNEIRHRLITVVITLRTQSQTTLKQTNTHTAYAKTRMNQVATTVLYGVPFFSHPILQRMRILRARLRLHQSTVNPTLRAKTTLVPLSASRILLLTASCNSSFSVEVFECDSNYIIVGMLSMIQKIL